MDREKLEHFRERLIDERDRINRVIDGIKDDLGLESSLRDGTSELSSYDNHPGDLASETFEMEKNQSLKANEVSRLKMIEDALSSIERGSYGICQYCGKEIGEERLEAVPYTNLCINCAEHKDSTSRTYWQDRPVEEAVIGHPFGSNDRDPEDYTGYDGEDVWQELESYDSLNYHLWDDEDEDMQGIVEETDKISNNQYKRQLPD